MTGQPRKHHFVPQFYLAGFTKNGKATDRLFVFDKAQTKQWPSTPKGSAHQRDFHEVEIENEDPMVIEKKLAVVEQQWAAAIRRVVDNQSIPEDERFGDLMMFAAFMGVRIPRIRDTIAQFIDGVSKSQVHLMLATEEGRNSFRRIVEDQGKKKLTDEDFEELVEFGRQQEYDVDFEQTWHVQQMIRMGIQLAPLLSQRRWSLWTVKDGAPDLICSDSPVAPTWLTPMPGPMSPAFGTPNTIVSVPLNRRTALVSLLETELGDRELDGDGVAVVDSMTGLYANQLFASESDFVWMKKDGSVGACNDLFEAIRAADASAKS